MRRVLQWLGIGLVVLIAGSAVFQRVATAGAFRRYKPMGRMVDVGGYSLHIHCVGDGPSVVLESGLGGWTVDWTNVQDEIGSFARVCSYDRAGLGWSESGPSFASAPEGIARQLKRLLDAADVPEPHVMVGHSLGGIYVREFARRYPDSVTGMVFVDSSHEEMGKAVSKEARADAESQVRMLKYARYLMPLGIQRLIKQPVANAADLPAAEQARARALGYRSTSYRAFYDEIAPLLAGDKDGTLRLGSVPDVPLVVLASGSNIRENERWRGLQEELASLSSSGRLEIAEESGHFIQVESPRRVVDAVREVVKASEGGKA